MSFAGDLKAELLRTRPSQNCCQTALLSALFHTAGSLSLSRTGLAAELVTKSEPLLAYALKNLHLAYSDFSEEDFLAGETNGCRNLRFSQGFSDRLLRDLLLLVRDGEGETHVERGIAPRLTEKPCCRKAYIKGAYLGCGTIKINRSSGYHLEFSLSGGPFCAQLAGLLNGEGFRFKYAERGENVALYLKDAEEISDFLAYLGASHSVLALQELLLERQKNNSLNRRNNCYLANVDKSVDASIRQVGYISVIEERVGLSNLDEELRRTCELRLDHPDASIAELAELLGITKSGANHRLRKLKELARRALEGTEGGGED